MGLGGEAIRSDFVLGISDGLRDKELRWVNLRRRDQGEDDFCPGKK